jgi:hypothetical protein
MGCIHCGQNIATEEYTFRFTPEDQEPADVELGVCDVCLEVLLTDADIELARPMAHTR